MKLESLQALGSRDKAIQAMYHMNSMICGYDIRQAKTNFEQLPKQLVSYDRLIQCVCEYRDLGDPNYRSPKEEGDKMKKKQLAISKMFGLFLTLLVVSAQRNATVR